MDNPDKIYYLDSSAWAKRYFLEGGSEIVRDFFELRQSLASSVLAYVDVAATLARRGENRETMPASKSELWPRFEADWNEIFSLEIEPPVILLAASLARSSRLRGADAIHLATADLYRQRLIKHDVSLVFVTSDKEPIAAAISIQLDVLDPTAPAAEGPHA